MTIKKIILSLMILSSSLAYAGERDDINQIIKEIHYIKEVATQLKKKNNHCKAKVCFNYDALLQQLYATELGIKEYLNLHIKSLHNQAPQAVVKPLHTVRKN